MRENKYRAKAINREEGFEYRTSYKNGDWVYGLLERHELRWDDKSIPATMRNEYGVSNIDVDECTLGQYIGKEDKKGVEIYEGDIVLATYKEMRDFRGVKYESEIRSIETVVFNEEKAAFELQIDIDGVKLYRGLAIGDKVNNVELVSLEVIGNVYDNPELLKGE